MLGTRTALLNVKTVPCRSTISTNGTPLSGPGGGSPVHTAVGHACMPGPTRRHQGHPGCLPTLHNTNDCIGTQANNHGDTARIVLYTNTSKSKPGRLFIHMARDSDLDPAPDPGLDRALLTLASDLMSYFLVQREL